MYVLEEMTFWEMTVLLDGLWRKNRDSWEQARLVGYTTARSQMKKGTSFEITKYFPFPWDDGDPQQRTEEITAEEKERLAARAAQIERQMAEKLKNQQ